MVNFNSGRLVWMTFFPKTVKIARRMMPFNARLGGSCEIDTKKKCNLSEEWKRRATQASVHNDV